jgi:hypothetical protein
MNNWQRRVREHLNAHGLPREVRAEIVIELAAHLEEIYEEARADHMTEAAALALALQQVDDWHILAAEVVRAKSPEGLMNHRTKSFWLPALVTFLGASLSLAMSQIIGVQPRMLWLDRLVMWFYLPWLATLPIFGGLGAYLSRRAHGSILSRLAASLSPALIVLAVMCLILPWGLYIEGLHSLTLFGFGIGLINWVAVPALALLLGAAPFLQNAETENCARALF